VKIEPLMDADKRGWKRKDDSKYFEIVIAVPIRVYLRPSAVQSSDKVL
jgi:hypothetical protein